MKGRFGCSAPPRSMRSEGQKQSGLSLIEFAIFAGLLIAALVAATDFSMAILARQELEGATREGVEYATNKGYKAEGVKFAVLKGRSGNGFKLVSNVEVKPTIVCACHTDLPSLASGATPSGDQVPKTPTGSTSPECSGLCPVVGGEQSLRRAYAIVIATADYDPFFAGYWPGLQDGKVRLTARYIGKTYFVQ